MSGTGMAGVLLPAWPDISTPVGPIGVFWDESTRHLASGRPEDSLRVVESGIRLLGRRPDPVSVTDLGLLRTRALLDLGRYDDAVVETTRLLEVLEPGGPTYRRALVHSLVAAAMIQSGRPAAALDPLAEATWLVHRSEADLSGAVARVVAEISVASVLLDLLLVEPAADMLPRPADVPRSPPRLAIHVARFTARVHALWGMHLESLEDPAAEDHYRRTASAAIAVQHFAQVMRAPILVGCGLALEVFACERLGHAAPAAARARSALATGAPADAIVEWHLGRVALARVAAADGDLPTARHLLAAVRRACASDRFSPWSDLVRVAAAEVEALDEHPALQGWRRIAASGAQWIWQERQARAWDLHHRVLRRELMERSARTARELLIDPLTGLGNRRRLDAELVAGPTSAGIVFVDLDEFKAINDTHGHAAGDVVLRRVAALLRECCGDQDVVVRYGGDEFVVLLGDDGDADADGDAYGSRASAVGHAVLERVRAEPWLATAGIPTVTVSVGVAAGEAGRESLLRSDAAMLAAKRAGRDGMVRL